MSSSERLPRNKRGSSRLYPHPKWRGPNARWSVLRVGYLPSVVRHWPGRQAGENFEEIVRPRRIRLAMHIRATFFSPRESCRNSLPPKILRRFFAAPPYAEYASHAKSRALAAANQPLLRNFTNLLRIDPPPPNRDFGRPPAGPLCGLATKCIDAQLCPVIPRR